MKENNAVPRGNIRGSVIEAHRSTYTTHVVLGKIYLDGRPKRTRRDRKGPFRSMEEAAQYVEKHPDYWKFQS